MNLRTLVLVGIGVIGLGIGFLLGRNKEAREKGPDVEEKKELASSSARSSAASTRSERSKKKSPGRPSEEDEDHERERKQFEEELVKGREIADFPARYKVLSDLFRRWAAADAEAAFAAWAETPEVLGMGASYPILARLRQQVKFSDLLDRVLEVSHVQLRAEGLRQLGGEVFGLKDRRGAMDLLLERTEGEARAKAIVSGVGSWRMKEDHEVVWGWVQEHREVFDSTTMASLERAVSSRLIASDPEQAVSWLLERATSESRPDHLRHIVRTWSRHEPTETAKWLATLTPGKDTDHAVAEYASAVMQDDPAGAAEWTVVITDEAMRRQTLNMALGVWRVTDPTAAAEFAAEVERP